MQEFRYVKVTTTGERLRQIMAEKGLRQIDIVNATGISRSKISSYLSGTYSPKADKMVSLARFLNVSETWLWGFDAPKEISSEQRDDALSKLMIRIKTDKHFSDLTMKLLKLTPKQLSCINTLLTTFTEESGNTQNK